MSEVASEADRHTLVRDEAATQARESRNEFGELGMDELDAVNGGLPWSIIKLLAIGVGSGITFAAN